MYWKSAVPLFLGHPVYSLVFMLATAFKDLLLFLLQIYELLIIFGHPNNKIHNIRMKL